MKTSSFSSIWCNSCFFFFVGITCFWCSIITTPFFHWFPTFLQKKNRMIFGWWIYIYLVRICSKLVGTLRHYLLPKHTFATLDQSWFWPNWRKKLNSSDSNWCMTTWILLQCTGVAGGLDSDYTKSRTGFRFLGLIILARFLFENLVPYVFLWSQVWSCCSAVWGPQTK